MTVKKDNERQAIPIDPIDPAVENALGSPSGFYSQLARIKKMTPTQRKKAERDRQRNRITIDLSKDIEDILDMFSESESVPKSQLTVFLILLGLQSLEEKGSGSISWAKQPSRGLRYLYELPLPDLPPKLAVKLEDFRRRKK